MNFQEMMKAKSLIHYNTLLEILSHWHFSCLALYLGIFEGNNTINKSFKEYFKRKMKVLGIKMKIIACLEAW